MGLEYSRTHMIRKRVEAILRNEGLNRNRRKDEVGAD